MNEYLVSDYLVLQSVDALERPVVEIWVDILLGADGITQHCVPAHRNGNDLVVEDRLACRRISGLSEQVWVDIEGMRDGVLVVCGPSGVVARTPWHLIQK